MLAVICSIALLMPVYVLFDALLASDEKITFGMAVDTILLISICAPLNVIFIAILFRLRTIQHMRAWAVIATFSALLDWIGMAVLIHALT